ncbi:hypothetical protein HO173_001655 [Letharia columbiana]|uniref:Cytochrome P450 n=1 Tax=Letharia columbiana TaxID=112416 RepID=A0A8H6L936_9LECA|nr:uncharacterized protein HO173_001655 [Letharia columbiana]KAF6240045.1 hypothetical protein HO173_001655 [Letharia columbiana]
MDLPWLPIGLSSVAGSFVLVHNAPQYSISASYVKTFLVLETIQILLGLLWEAILYPKLFSPIRHLPQPKGGSFFNGQLKRISAEPTGEPHRDWIKNVPNEGLIYYTTILNQGRLLLTSPQALSEVLTTKSYDFIKPQQLRNGLGRVLGIGLLLAEGDEHKRQRKNLMPAFAYRHVKDLYPVFWEKSIKLVNGLMSVARKEGKESVKSIDNAAMVDISGWFSRATLDIIGVAGMGHDFDAIDNPDTKINVTYRSVFSPSRQQRTMALLGLFLPQWFLRALPVAHNNKIVESSNTIKEVCRELIREKKEKLDQKQKRVDADILSVALESGGFTEEDLVNQMMTFLAAGHETTASAMTWAFYLLCLHPEVQTRLREEIRANLPPIDDTETVTAASLDQCHYLHAVCNEVLRVYSPVPGTIREAGRDTSILGQYVPKGTKILLSPWAVNTATSLWGPDADKFNPDRWMGPGKANSGGAESNYAFLTFLHGPRSCIGQAFAKAEFACLMAAVVGRFEVKIADEDFKLVIKGSITAKPKNGLTVRIKPIEGW